MDGSSVRVDAGMRGPVPIPVSRTNRCRVNSMASQKKGVRQGIRTRGRQLSTPERGLVQPRGVNRSSARGLWH